MPLYNPSTASSSADQSYELSNLSLTCSVGSSALTIALKDKSGADASASSVIKIGMRSSTLTAGTYNQRTVTAALSLVVSSGSTLGTLSASAHNLWVYAIDNSGTIELAISQTLFPDNTVISTTAEGGAGAADSNNVLYSTTARSNVPFRLIGKLISTQATAGTWAAVPTTVSVGDFGTLAYGQQVSARYTSAAGQSIANSGDTIVDFGTRDYDTVNAVTTGASWKFTAPVAGRYRFNFSCAFSASTYVVNNQIYATLYKNNSAVQQGPVSTAQTTTSVLLATSMSGEILLASGDFIDLRLANSRTAGATTLIANATVVWFTVDLI